MSMQTMTTSWTAPDGAEIFIYQWLPSPGVPAAGVVQIVHGLAEHAGRYARFAEALVGLGFVVIGSDHRGHGRTSTEADVGHFGDADGWTRVVRDLSGISAWARERWPGVPRVLFGHSMGSTLALHMVSGTLDVADALVLSGPVGQVGRIRHVGAVVARAERWRMGPRGRSSVLHRMSFGDFNKPFEPARTPMDWLSRDPAEVDKYIADRRCGFIVTTQHWCDHLDAISRMLADRFLAHIPHELPVFIVAGEKDPVSGLSAQLPAFVERLRKLGPREVELKIYPDARHELLNDTVREQVTADILGWVKGHVKV
jgi:alpha-beta hydrolase superfamily lysophospholipase